MDRRAGRAEQPPRVKALDVDGVRTVAIITVLWAVAFVILALQRTQLDEAGRGWWIWTCLAGVGLGLLGLEYCRKRRDAIAKAELEEEADTGFDDVGDWRDGELAQLAAEDHADLGYDEAPSGGGYDEDQPSHPHPHYTEPLPGHPQGEVFPPVPYRGDERPATPPQPPQQPPYPGPEQQRPHRPEQSPTYSPSGRPPPGYKTGEFPVVPAAPGAGPPAPVMPPGVPPGASPPHASEPPHRMPDVATPAGYSPDPDRTRRHPRDEELARRRQEEQTRQTDTGPHIRPEFLADEDDPGYTAAEGGRQGASHAEMPSYRESERSYREPEPSYGDSQLDFGEPAPQYTGSDTGYSTGEYDPGYDDEPEPAHREPERPASAGSELLSDLLGDEPSPPSHAPEFLVDDEPAVDQDDDYGGEYRGRRARRD